MKKEHGGNVYKISRDTGLNINDIIDFSANINPLGVPDSGRKAILDSIDGLINYPDPDYIEFRKAIAKHHKIDFENIVPGNGAIDSLFSAVAAVMPNKVLVSVPSFVEYEKAVEKAGAVYVPSYRGESDAYRFNTDGFIDDINEDVDLVVLCNPNNPTGDYVSKDDILRILKRCREVSAHFLLDEAFMEFAEHFGAESAIPYVADYPELIVSRSLTKYFAVPGLRAGYLVVGSDVIRDRLVGGAEPWKLNHFADHFTRSVIEDEQYCKDTEMWLRKENKELYEALKGISDLEVHESYANYLFLRCLKLDDLKDRMLMKGIAIRSCDNYDGIGQGYYRVAVKDSDSNRKLVDAFKDVLAD